MRQCAWADCETVLSRYNPDPLCAVHQRAPRDSLERTDVSASGPPDAGMPGEMVPFDQRLLRPNSKGARGICSGHGCQQPATVCAREVTLAWRAWCDQHRGPNADEWAAIEAEDERLRAARRAEEERWQLELQQYRAERLARRPRCPVCDQPIGWHGVLVSGIPSGPALHHRRCVLTALGIDVPDDVAQEIATFDEFDIFAAARGIPA